MNVLAFAIGLLAYICIVNLTRVVHSGVSFYSLSLLLPLTHIASLVFLNQCDAFAVRCE